MSVSSSDELQNVIIKTLQNKGSSGLNGSVKSLEHLWSLSNAERVVYSRKSLKIFFKIVILGTVQ